MYWVIGTLGVAMLPQLVSMPPHLAPLVLFPMAWRLAAEMRGWAPLPALPRVLLTIACVFATIFTYGGLVGRRAAVGLLTVMLALKLLEAFRVRDARVVASLSLFLCATQFLFSQGLLMLAYGGLTVVCALVSLAYLHRKEAFLPVGVAPQTGQSLFSELGFSARLLGLAIPVALALFLLFPRWGTPLWGMPEEALDARSGLSNSMSPGSIQSLFMDDTPAFRVEFRGVFPHQNELYWRGPVFWNFDGREWTGSFIARNIKAESVPAENTAPWRYTVQMEPTEQRWMFALDYPAIVPPGASLTMDYQLYARRPITQLRSYEMASDPRFTDAPQLSNTLRKTALELPAEFNPRTRQLMQAWRAETPGTAELVNRALAYFNQQDFFYTLNPPLLSRHTVDEFLFETRNGFCEHYASAFTVMMRMAGVPARVVTGYQGGWYNGFDKYLLVRQSDAHAWVEVWLTGTGWTRVDPTAAVAPSRVERGALDALAGGRHLFDFVWLRNVRNGFDVLQRRWNGLVISFGADRQASLFMPFGMGRLDSTGLVGIMAIVITLLSLLTLPLILRFRRTAVRDPATKLWNIFRRKLARAGIATRASTGPQEVAVLAQDRPGADSAEISRIADLYLHLRYAPGAPGFPEFARAVKAFSPPAGPRHGA